MANVPNSTAPDGSGNRVPSFRDNVKERELVRQCQNGTPDAFEELIRRHQQRIFSVVRSILRRREDVEDVAQQVFIKAFVSIRGFDMRAAFSTWLYKIAVNECWDYLRRKRVRPLLYEADLSEEQNQHLSSYVATEKAPADASKRAELRQTVELLLEQLDDGDRQMLVLKEVEGLSVQEISEVMELNINTVKVRLFRARAKLVEWHQRRQPRAARASAGKKRE
jgi:RNA polymerase sigma-70 factor (ECF subfamily)